MSNIYKHYIFFNISKIIIIFRSEEIFQKEGIVVKSENLENTPSKAWKVSQVLNPCLDTKFHRETKIHLESKCWKVRKTLKTNK